MSLSYSRRKGQLLISEWRGPSLMSRAVVATCVAPSLRFIWRWNNDLRLLQDRQWGATNFRLYFVSVNNWQNISYLLKTNKTTNSLPKSFRSLLYDSFISLTPNVGSDKHRLFNASRAMVYWTAMGSIGSWLCLWFAVGSSVGSLSSLIVRVAGQPIFLYSEHR